MTVPVFTEKRLPQARQRYGIAGCFAPVCTLVDSQRGHAAPFGQRPSTNHAAAVASSGKRWKSSSGPPESGTIDAPWHKSGEYEEGLFRYPRAMPDARSEFDRHLTTVQEYAGLNLSESDTRAYLVDPATGRHTMA